MAKIITREIRSRPTNAGLVANALVVIHARAFTPFRPGQMGQPYQPWLMITTNEVTALPLYRIGADDKAAFTFLTLCIFN